MLRTVITKTRVELHEYYSEYYSRFALPSPLDMLMMVMVSRMSSYMNIRIVLRSCRLVDGCDVVYNELITKTRAELHAHYNRFALPLPSDMLDHLLL